MSEPKADVEARHLQRLAAFVTRARRVEEHSLAQDKDRLRSWRDGDIQMRILPDGVTEAWIETPEEEALDSLAARCRPFLLKRDIVYYGNVMKAVAYFVRDGALAHSGRSLSEGWRRIDPERDEFAYSVSRMGQGGTFSDPVTDKSLARAWLYGDVMHADQRAVAKVAPHDIDARLRAGSLLICGTAVLAVATLNLIRSGCGAGHITLDDGLFTQTVLAQPPRWRRVVGMAMGPPGTSRADLEAAIGSLDMSEAD